MEVRKEKVVFVFSDPGAAKSILALATQLRTEKQQFIYSDRMHDFYSNFGLNVNAVSPSEVDSILEDLLPDFVITGTSYTSDIEKLFISACKKRQIPVFSQVDHWTDIKRRFEYQGQLIYSDEIWIIDEKAKEIALNEGIPETLLKVKGNPYYDFLKSWEPSISRDEWKKQNNIPEDKKLIMFAAEPLSKAGGVNRFGLDEKGCLKLLESRIASELLSETLVLIKMHPNQDKEYLMSAYRESKPRYEFRIFETDDLNTAIYYSDAVAGIFSNLLIEAHQLGKPVYRILEGLKIPDPLGHLRIGKVLGSGESITSL